MVEDGGVRLLLTAAELRHRLPPGAAPVVVVDDEEEGGGPAEDEEGHRAPEARATPGNLACLLFTSGSTGRPKGVLLPHRGLVNRLLWAQSVYRLTPPDVVLQKAPFAFDFSLWECFAPLIAGARLVLAKPGGHQDTAYLAATIARYGVTIVHFVPSLLDAFLREEQAPACVSLRQVFAGGERLAPELRERFLALFPGVPLDNQYGPTEISIDTTRFVCAPGQDARRVPLGLPIANTRIHLLDRRGELAPLGVAGRLHVAGAGLARGYAGRPDWTAERFVPDPFDLSGSGARLYDTGDLARRLPDGVLDFLGRSDQQVKVRGVRIEPAEVEGALARHPGVAAAAVGVDGDGSRLVAWIVPRPGAAEGEPTAAAIREHLRERLPEAMIPSLYVRLAALPLTPSGKLDRGALAVPVDQIGRAHV
jgi:amino acid adenylation domain-containing protein